MRILVVGAGAVGGYFGGRLLEAGRDVTFLVRQRRAVELARTGLVIHSQFGNLDVPAPATVMAEDLQQPFDLILLSCKAFDLENAMEAFAPAVGPVTAILPLLNGMRHLDALRERFGGDRVLGGLCVISTALDSEGRIIHFNDVHSFAFGELDGASSARLDEIAALLSGARFDWRRSEAILQEMWEKWVFIATAAGINCLMRAPAGDIVAAGAAELATTLLDECAAIAASQGFLPSPATVQRTRGLFSSAESGLAASMFRDVERGAPIEAEHIIGDMLRRGDEQSVAAPLLRIVYFHLKAYEARRKRESVSRAN